MTLEVGLWQRTLASVDNDIHASARERLRASYELCRSSSALIAAEISKDQPNYTVHDITHVDGLWDMADVIAGPDYDLSPLEGYVLGCAMLVHDLAMSIAAYPARSGSLMGSERWRDAIYVHFQQETGRAPTAAELDNPPSRTLLSAQRELLRELHAEQASRIPHQMFRDRDGDSTYFLISDTDLRNMFGDVIGRIAASHWWDVAKLAEEFDTKLGAPAVFPKEWTVDPLKLACLLRVADVSHLDSRRAPGFLRAIRSVDDESKVYWIFQERLNRPWPDVDRLTYTAQQPFTAADSDAWWICVDTLRMVDRELRSVDVTLADLGRPRFVARSVAYVDDLKRLARLIPVRDWFPVDARVQVSDVIDLVRKFGGKQLYGNDYTAALRELVSNAADAIRARRALMNRQMGDELRLRVQVEIRYGQDGTWLIVRDNGVGMSREVMSGALLDFGKSYWRSDPARREFPGLISSGFNPTGQFGVGFFAVFMLGRYVQVTSRRFDLGTADTNVLIFSTGLNSRPLLRKGFPNEFLPFGGTEIAVKLDSNIVTELRDNGSLEDLCSSLCPTADFDLDVMSKDGSLVKAIAAGDWKDCPAHLLLYRLYDESLPGTDASLIDPSLSERLRVLVARDGAACGRAAILLEERWTPPLISGMVSSGGMRTSSRLQHIGGVLCGEAQRAARDYALPTVDKKTLADWASEQAQIVMAYTPTPRHQLKFSEVVRALGGDPGKLIVAEARSGYLQSGEISDWAADLDVVRLYQDAAYAGSPIRNQENLRPDVLVTAMGLPGMLSGVGMMADWHMPMSNSLLHWCARLIFKAWNAPFDEAVRQIKAQNDISNEYSARNRDRGLISGDDPDYPLRKEVGKTPDGQVVFDGVKLLKRPSKISREAMASGESV